MIHSEDNGQVMTKITSNGDLFVFCPECHGIWQTTLKTLHRPKEARPIVYGGTGINLDMGSSERPPREHSATEESTLAKQLFPEAFK